MSEGEMKQTSSSLSVVVIPKDNSLTVAERFGEVLMLLLQRDFDAAREIALTTPIQFPNGRPCAVVEDASQPQGEVARDMSTLMGYELGLADGLERAAQIAEKQAGKNRTIGDTKKIAAEIRSAATQPSPSGKAPMKG